MKQKIKILSLFFEIIFLKVNNAGVILEVVLNTKKDFDVSKVKTLQELFSSKEDYRVKRLLESSDYVKKNNMELKNSRGFVDVETLRQEGSTYVCFHFSKSKQNQEAEYDRNVERLAFLSNRDPMTKVLNRQGFFEQVSKLIKSSDEKKRIGVIFFDLDNLKYVNDTFGHIAGDNAIMNFTETLLATIRHRDLIARFGGDEFVVVVEEVTGLKSTVFGLSKRLLKKLSKNKKEKGLVTASMGVHVFEVGKLKKLVEKKPSEFKKACFREIGLADKAAYEAKKIGKNQIAVSEDFKKYYKV